MIRANERGPVLVTGSAGFIGFHLCSALVARNIDVVGVDNMNSYYDVKLKELRNSILAGSKSYVFVQLDISNREAIQEVFREYAPQVVVNLAAQAGVRYSIDHPDEYILSNVVGFLNVLEACRRHPVEHLVYASSSSVYGLNRTVPFSERDMTDKPASLYAATKKSDELMAYAYARLYGIAATGLRFFTVYGPYGRPDMAYFSFAERVLDGRPIQVFNNGELRRDFTYVDDVIEALVRLLGAPPQPDGDGVQHRVYNVGNSHPVGLLEFIATLEEKLGTRALREYLPMQAGDVYETYADVRDLEEDFDFRPSTSLDVGLGRFVEWYLEYRRSSRGAPSGHQDLSGR